MLEQAMDELALALGIDPLELRRRNHADVDQVERACRTRASSCSPATTAPPSSPAGSGRDALREPQRATACCAAWAARRRSGGAAAARRRTRRCGSTPTGHAHVVDRHPGHRHRHAHRRRRSSRPRSSGCRSTDVRVVGGDTRPERLRPGGGRLADDAVGDAGRALGRGEGAQDAPAARRATCSRSRPTTSRCATAGSARTTARIDADVTEVTEKLGNATIDGSGSRGPNPDGFVVNTFGCQIAQVAVDPGLGEVRVERIVAVHDVGRVVNPLDRLEPGRGRRAAGDRLRAHRRSSSSTRRPACRSTRTSTTTSSRRSPTCPRS